MSVLVKEEVCSWVTIRRSECFFKLRHGDASSRYLQQLHSATVRVRHWLVQISVRQTTHCHWIISHLCVGNIFYNTSHMKCTFISCGATFITWYIHNWHVWFSHICTCDKSKQRLIWIFRHKNTSQTCFIFIRTLSKFAWPDQNDLLQFSVNKELINLRQESW